MVIKLEISINMAKINGSWAAETFFNAKWHVPSSSLPLQFKATTSVSITNFGSG